MKKIPRRLSYEPFNQDVIDRSGYRYSKNPQFSSQLSNDYLTSLTKKIIKKLITQAQIKTVIDMGCGDGFFTNLLAQQFSQLDFIGTDAADRAVKLAQLNFPETKYKYWNLMKKNLSDTCDLGILRGVIHHLPDPGKGIKNAALVCDYLIIIEPNGWNPILKIIEKISPYHRQHHERSYTNQQLISWCKNSHMYLMSQQFVGLVPFFCPNWMAKTLKKIEPMIEKSWLAPVCCAQVIQLYKKR
jgi:SAM-dependent methyltransferase